MPCAQALLFRPSGGRSLWDQEGLIVNGTWYMWYDNNFCPDGKPGAGISNYGLATSSDGVNWADQGISMSPWGVNPCNESGFNDSIPVAGIGSGSCWEDPSRKGKYIINYSENIPGADVGQQIRFSTSSDLKTWTPAIDVPSFHEDGVHYAKGRWDTVMQFTDKQNLMHGWWTATPKAAPPSSLPDGVATAAFGYGTSTDGLHWTLQPPAWVVIPKGMPGSKQIEVGGVAQLPNGKWYGQACATSWGHINNLGGCFSVVSDRPGGPFVLQEKNWALLGYAAKDGIPAYFSRFYVGPDGEALANYQQNSEPHHCCGPGTYLAPLKKVVVDSSDNVTVRWVWLPANDALKHQPVAALKLDAATGALTPALDIASGAVVEGQFVWGSAAISFCNENGTVCGGKFSLTNSTVMQMHNSQAATFHSFQGIGESAPQPSRSLRIAAGDTVSWRLLYRQGMYEVYFSEGTSCGGGSGSVDSGGTRTMFFGASFANWYHLRYCDTGEKFSRPIVT